MFTIRKWWLLLVAALVPLSLSAQTTDGLLANKFTSATRGTAINLLNTGIAYHQMTWHVVGTVTGCTIALDSSANGSTWSAGGVITGQTCTSNGQSAITNDAVNYVSMNMTAFTATAGSYVTVTWTGWVSSPSAGGGVSGCTTAGGIAYENGTNNVLTCSANLTWTSSGQILSMNGTGTFESTVAQAASATTGLLEQITGADTGGTAYSAIFGAADPTTSGTIVTSLIGTIGSAFPAGTGSYTSATVVAGVQGQVGNGSSGTINTATGFITAPVTNSGGGSIVNLSGYYAQDQGGVGTTLNAGYYAAAQTAGANNWGFYSTTGNKDHFGTVTAASLNGLTTPSASGGAVITQTIASGTAALGTSLISSGTCAAAVTVSASGVATTDNLSADFNADPTGTAGYTPSTSGILTIVKYPTSGNVNFKVCNNTGSGITPGAVTLNWRVTR